MIMSIAVPPGASSAPASAFALVAFHAGATASAAHAALKSAIATIEQAEHCAVLWFAEIMGRELYRQLGYSSMHQYAAQELSFSRTKTFDFIRLARKLDELPAVRESVAGGKIGYTKAREIIKVATAKTEKLWLEEAAGISRRQLEEKVSHARQQARAARRTDPDQGQLLQGESGAVGAAGMAGAAGPKALAGEVAGCGANALAVEIPVRVHLEMSPEQFARYEALWEKLYKLGGVPRGMASGRAGRRGASGGRAKVEVILAGLAAVVESLDGRRRGDLDGEAADHASELPRGDCGGPGGGAVDGEFPRGDSERSARRVSGPPFQIHIHQCLDCRKATVQTAHGELACDKADLERAACDAHVKRPGQRNTSTIPPAVRRAVLERDRHRCQAPGCGNTRFLEVHHVQPRVRGGSNRPDNLITMCAACHRLAHERPGMGGVVGLWPALHDSMQEEGA
jgi:hypothetical protein